MTDLLDQLEQRADRTRRGDPRTIYRSAVAQADAPIALDRARDEHRHDARHRPQRVVLAALVASIAVLAIGGVWFRATREQLPPVADRFPATDVRFGPLAPPDGFALSTVRIAMYGPPPEVRLTTTVYAPDAEATSSLTVLVRRGASFTPDIMMPDGATTETIGGHEVRIADGDRLGSGSVIAGWDRQDGSRVFVIGRGLTIDDVRAAIPGLVIGDDDRSTLAVVPTGFERQFADDGTGSALAATGSTAVMLQYASVDGRERQLSVKSVPGARFEAIALRWLDPSVEPIVLADGSPAFLMSDGRTWVKQLPEGLAVVNPYQVGPDVDVAAFVAGTRSLTPVEWADVVGNAEVVEGLVASESYTEVVATVPEWSTRPAP